MGDANFRPSDGPLSPTPKSLANSSPAGDFVVMLYASANRDQSVFGPTADRLDVTREP